MPTISGARVVTPSGVLENGVVELEDGLITGVRSSTGTPSERTIVPGFVDLQVNGVDDVDVSDAAGHDWERLDTLLLAQGVTTWCPTLVTAPLPSYGPALERIDGAAERQRMP